MFRLEQIISATRFSRSFSTIVRELEYRPGHILVTRKSGKHFVFLNAELFQQLLDFRYAAYESEQSRASDSSS
jgi:hypothetical protein